MGYTEQVELILKLGHLIDQVEDETALSLGITTALAGAIDADLAVLPLPIGIGIAAGEAISGNFGSPEHAEYSSIDMAVNLASRLGSTAEGDEILVDERTFQLLGRRLIATPLPPKHQKGFDQPMPVWQGSGLLE